MTVLARKMRGHSSSNNQYRAKYKLGISQDKLQGQAYQLVQAPRLQLYDLYQAVQRRVEQCHHSQGRPLQRER